LTRKLNPWHVVIALAVGALLWHMYITKTQKGQNTARKSMGS
jgi:hypothetical protein